MSSRSLALVVLAVPALVLAPAIAQAIGEGVLPPNAPPMPTLVSGPPSQIGEWETPFEGEIPAVHIAMLPDQSILYWSGDVAGDRDNVYFLNVGLEAETRLLAPPYTEATVSAVAAAPGADLFCSGHTILPDGRVLAAGGSVWHATVSEGETSFVDGVPQTRVFDSATRAWTLAPDMAASRWYPTVMTVNRPDASAIVSSGIGRITDPSTHHRTMEAFDGAWRAVAGGDNLLPLYPRLLQVPSGPMKGGLYYEPGGTLWGPFGEHPEELRWNIAQAYDFETKTWRDLGPNLFGARQSPDHVLLPLDPADGYRARLLNFAGTLQRSIVATSASELADLSTDPPTREVTMPLNVPRWQSTGVLLPDGKVLAVGGGLYDNVMVHGFPDPAVMTAEVFDPATGAWTELAPMTIPREYHGTALLLPDGRVLVGGHVPNPVPWKAMRDNLPPADQAPQTKFEIFQPPYLHWGVTQPTIADAPAAVTYGETFSVATPDAGRVVDAILVRHGAVTHSNDPGQRAVVLPIADRAQGTLTFVAPPDGDVATPGPWMLFLRVQHDNGLVPGIAKTVMIG